MATIHTIGRRKKSIARVYLQEGKGEITVNDKKFKDYFSTPALHYKIEQALQVTETSGQYDVRAFVKGGGITGQAEAVRLGISRALVNGNPEHRTALKPLGLLTRDPRMVERKKFGQKKARKKYQFSKR